MSKTPVKAILSDKIMIFSPHPSLLCQRTGNLPTIRISPHIPNRYGTDKRVSVIEATEKNQPCVLKKKVIIGRLGETSKLPRRKRLSSEISPNCTTQMNDIEEATAYVCTTCISFHHLYPLYLRFLKKQEAKQPHTTTHPLT